MKPELSLAREHLQEIADCAGIDFDSIRTEYSGRGMFGTGCIGVVGTAADGIAFILGYLDSKLAGFTAASMNDDAERDDVFQTAYALAQATRTDSMGKDIITYWPDLTLEDGDEE